MISSSICMVLVRYNYDNIKYNVDIYQIYFS